MPCYDDSYGLSQVMLDRVGLFHSSKGDLAGARLCSQELLCFTMEPEICFMASVAIQADFFMY